MILGRMSSEVTTWLRGHTPASRWGRLAVGAYLLVSVASVAWGLSGGSAPNNALAARVAWNATAEFPTLSVTNSSGSDWTAVRVVVDGRYFAEAERVPRGQTLAVTTAQLHDGYLIPRPSGLFLYEQAVEHVQAPGAPPPATYRPHEVEVIAAEGEMTTQDLGP
jgi:hypothetical protein